MTLLPFLATSEEPIAAGHPCAQQHQPHAKANHGGAKGWPLLAPVSDRNPNHQKYLGIGAIWGVSSIYGPPVLPL